MYAFFAVGEKEDEENTGLLEPKEELLSGDEDNEDNEDEDEELPDEVEAPEGRGGAERPQLEPNESQQQSWPTADEPAVPAAVAKEEGAEEEQEERSEELQHPRDEVVASDAAANANGHCKSSGHEEDAVDADEPEDLELDDELLSLSGDEDYDDEELQSLDSFYSVPTIHSMRAGAITIEIGVGGVILAAGDGTPGCSTPVPRVSFPYAAVLWLPGSLTTF
ncbi:uncharacterized protein Dere_GG20459 [Drosophila erecta]|uniref:Uncharacterized protein n=1 Tax=Drosophila erecta TaxID=7220 RepID=A0A0Q5W068_DROER|nr:uncharacterized protein Dere_GG20459 [Drosophila erecta]